MAYQVDKFNGTPLTSVEDGTIDSTTDLRFIGKNYAGYGEVQNENFLHLLENFANTSAPPKTIVGQIWYDSGNKKLKFYDGVKFKVAGGAEVSTTAPSNLAIGEFWWDSATKQLKAWSGTEFVTVGPEASPDLGTSSVVAQVVADTNNSNHTILKLIAGGKCVAIINQDDAFTLNSTNPITDFTTVKKGITLVNTNASGVSQNNHVFWGSASNALALNGIAADQFLQKNNISAFTDQVSLFSDNGFTLGDGNDLRIRVENGDEVVVENQLGNAITIRITTPGVTAVSRDVAVFSNAGISPADTNIYSLGANLARWSNVFATTMTANTFVGALTGASTGVHTGNVVATDDAQVLVNASTKEIGYDGAVVRGNLFGSVSGNVTGTASNASKLADKQASITITAATAEIPIRDASGHIYANRFIGTADKADQLAVGGLYRSASTAANANTIASRDASGDIYANLFQGTATAARYADLAEKYLADAEYAVGTVVVVGGEAEVTASSIPGQLAIGVVSANPAFMMNKDLEGGTYIALKGRVPVKVVGVVKKGDRLIAAANGCAVVGTSLHAGDVFAVALESNDSADVKLVEAVVL